jgi:hypothetical protein
MGWHSFIVAPPPEGDAVAADLLGRANDPTSWSFESLGAIVFRQRLEGADCFFFCPKASSIYVQLIAAKNGRPCDSPLTRTLTAAKSTRLILGFQTRWEPMKRPDRKLLSGYDRGWIRR